EPEAKPTFEADRVPCLSWARDAAGLQGFESVRLAARAAGPTWRTHWRPGRESDRSHHAVNGLLDAHVPAHDTECHAGAQAYGLALADSVPAYAGAFRFLLRYAALHHLHLARQILRPA